MDNTPPQAPNPLQFRQVDAGAPFVWLRRALDDMRAHPLPSLFYGLCFTVMGYLLAFALRHEPQHIAAATAGFLLLGPALAIGLYDISRRRERAEACSLLDTMTAWRTNIANIGLFSLALMLIFLIWARASLATFTLFFPDRLPTLEVLARQLLAAENLGFVSAWFGVGFLFALLAFSISVIAVPLMMDKQRTAIDAARASLAAVIRNLGPMAVWAAIIAWSAAAALLMGFLGILFVGPLLGHATWHAYRELVVEQ